MKDSVRNKVAVLIPAHCRPKILKLTIGSLLEEYDGSYDMSLHVSLHHNYQDWGCSLSDLTSMSNVDFSFVQEGDWKSLGTMCFSKQHSVALVALLESAYRDKDFTHIAIFDHDLLFRTDFVSWALREHGDKEWIFSLFDDIDKPRSVSSPHGLMCYCPKPSIWHMLLARPLVDRIMDDVSLVSPEQIGNTVYDTFAKVYEMALCEWGTRIKTLTSAEMKVMIQHYWSLSFSFGLVNAISSHKQEEHNDKIRITEDIYNSRFPDGIDHLLERIGISDA